MSNSCLELVNRICFPVIIGAAALAVTPTEAQAGDIGPTSSATIGISVSVAGRHRLLPMTSAGIRTDVRRPDARGFCLGFNGPAPALPVMLVAENRQSALPPCDRSFQAAAANRDDTLPRGLLLVRPE